MRQILLAALAGVAACDAQTILLDSFNAGSTTGAVRAGSTWIGNVTQNSTTLTVGGGARDDNGWGASGLTLNASGMNFLTITGQRDAGNTATTFAIQFEDRDLNTQVIYASTSAFALGTTTQVQIPLPAATNGFSFTQIASWSLGGGGLGAAPLRLTLDLLSFDTAPLTGATFAPLGTSTLGSPLSGTDGLKVNGPGTLILGAANTFTGDIVLTQGILQLGVLDALPAGAPVNLGSGATLNLAGFAATLGKLEGTGGTVALTGANLIVAQSTHTTFAGTITGNGGLTKSGNGTLTLTGSNTFSGATAITGGQLKLNGSAANSAFTLSGGGTLSGDATIGALTISSGGTLSPGNSPGTTNASSTTWEGGGTFNFEINKRDGIAGTNWDLLTISGSPGTLTISATSGNKFTVALNTLDFTTGNAGVPQNFSAAGNYTFAFVTTTTGISGFGSSAFTLNTSGVDSSLPGAWSIAQAGNNLNLTYTGSAIPEPSTYAAMFGAAALAAALVRRRNRRA